MFNSAVIITQARMGSSRLPGKVLLPVAGKTYLDWHLDRLQQTGQEIVVATSVEPADDQLAALVENRGIPVVRGSETDVLSRFVLALNQTDAEVVVRVTSDCPLLDPALLNAGVERYFAENDPDLYLANTLTRSYPRGFDFEIVSRAGLLDAARNATEDFEREHVTPYFYRTTAANRRLLNLPAADNNSDLRVTLDTVEDEELLHRLLAEHQAADLTVAEIVALLRAHPELVAINAAIAQKEI